MRGASHLSVNPADWVEAPQPQTNRQSVHKEACPPPSSHVKSACQLYDSPKSAWRQSLQHFDQAGSLDSAASETTTGRKRQTVLVWDLDETLILFHSLLSGAYAAHHSPEVSTKPALRKLTPKMLSRDLRASQAVITCYTSKCTNFAFVQCTSFGCLCRKLMRPCLWAKSGKSPFWTYVTSISSLHRFVCNHLLFTPELFHATSSNLQANLQCLLPPV